MKTIAITGSSGFVGTHLKNKFSQLGYTIVSIQREDLSNEEKLIDIMDKTDILINLAGANIINRWSDAYKKVLYESRIETTKALVNALEKSSKRPALFVSTSAVGIYKNATCYDEQTLDYDDGFLANVCKEWENEALNANKLGVRTLIFRFGIVLGNGGALGKMLTPFKLGLGGTISDGQQYFSFIHIEDLLNAYAFVFDKEECEGVFNLTAPEVTTNLGLTKALGKSLHRPTIFPIPKVVLNLIFGEGARVLTDGQCAKPQRLLDFGFEFTYKNIEETIESLV